MPWLPLAPVLRWGSLRKCWVESGESLGLTWTPHRACGPLLAGVWRPQWQVGQGQWFSWRGKGRPDRSTVTPHLVMTGTVPSQVRV